MGRPTIHGMRNSAEYGVWNSMRNRCNNPHNDAYHRYGARGIMVCDSWDTFANFYADIGPRPSPSYSIERKNNDKGYDKDNCIWATRGQQSINKENTRRFTYGGKSLTASEWGEIYNIKAKTLYARIVLRGWTIERAIAAPTRTKHSPPKEARPSRLRKPLGDIECACGCGSTFTPRSNVHHYYTLRCSYLAKLARRLELKAAAKRNGGAK